MDEQTVYGIKATHALFELRPQAIKRLFLRADRRDRLKGMLSWLAAQRLPYREVGEDELRKIASSSHHEGVVVVAEPLRFGPFPGASMAPGAWVAIDGVDNPHNAGAIARSAAFFGAKGFLAGGVSAGDKVNAALLRVSEGGAEYLHMCAGGDLAESLRHVPKGWPILGLETDAPMPLEQAPRWPSFVLVVGNEQTGLTPAVRKVCTGLFSIQGSGAIGSLNVSVAAGVALARLVPSA